MSVFGGAEEQFLDSFQGKTITSIFKDAAALRVVFTDGSWMRIMTTDAAVIGLNSSTGMSIMQL